MERNLTHHWIFLGRGQRYVNMNLVFMVHDVCVGVHATPALALEFGDGHRVEVVDERDIDSVMEWCTYNAV